MSDAPREWTYITLKAGAQLYRVEDTQDDVLHLSPGGGNQWFLPDIESENTLAPIILWKARDYRMKPSEVLDEWRLYAFSATRDLRLVCLSDSYCYAEAEQYIVQNLDPSYTPSFHSRGVGDNGIIAAFLNKIRLDGYYEDSCLGNRDMNPPEVMVTTHALSVGALSPGVRMAWPDGEDTDGGLLDFWDETLRLGPGSSD